MRPIVLAYLLATLGVGFGVLQFLGQPPGSAEPVARSAPSKVQQGAPAPPDPIAAALPPGGSSHTFRPDLSEDALDIALAPTGHSAASPDASVRSDADAFLDGTPERIDDRQDLRSAIAAYMGHRNNVADRGREALRILSDVRHPGLVDAIYGYAADAARTGDPALFGALARGLVSIQTPESIARVGTLMANLPADSEFPDIAGEALGNAREPELVSELALIVEDRYPGYQGALIALVGNGDQGVRQAVELALSDPSGALREDLKRALREAEYDDETTETLHELGLYEEFIEGAKPDLDRGV